MAAALQDAVSSDTSEAWPTHHLSLAALSERFNSRPRRCVLLMTGAMSPIHKGHVKTMSLAKRVLESEFGWHVLGGYISPSHDLYVRPKSLRFNTSFVNAVGRVAMAREAIRDVGWIEVGTWETSIEGRWPDFPEVVESLDRHLLQAFPCDEGDEGILVFYVCGGDLASKCFHGTGFKNPRHGLVVVDRADSRSVKWESSPDDLVFRCNALSEDLLGHVSSTKIRRILDSDRFDDETATHISRWLDRKVYMLIRKMQWYGCRHKHYVENNDGATKNSESVDNMVIEAEKMKNGTEDIHSLNYDGRSRSEETRLDLTDAVSRIHDQWVEEGRREAVSSLNGTDEDALRLGLHHGSKLGYELAYVDGVASALLSLGTPNHSQHSSNGLHLSSRAKSTAERLLEKLANFPIDRPASEDFQKTLDVIRGQFRLLCAQAKVPDVHLWQSGGKRSNQMSF